MIVKEYNLRIEETEAAQRLLQELLALAEVVVISEKRLNTYELTLEQLESGMLKYIQSLQLKKEEEKQSQILVRRAITAFSHFDARKTGRLSAEYIDWILNMNTEAYVEAKCPIRMIGPETYPLLLGGVQVALQEVR